MKETEPMRFEEPDYAWIEIDQERCNRCGICVDMCPMDVLRMGSKGYPIMRYIDYCWYCDLCVFVCPRQAVTLTYLPYLIR